MIWACGLGQCRSPGVQYRREPDAGAEVLGIGGDGDQGLGSGLEQQIIDDRLVVIGDVGDPRQGEDDVEIEPAPAQAGGTGRSSA
jgi:hypothetical protein